MSWIKLPGLPSYFYRQKILKEIESLVGKVAKLDMNTDSKARGRFARLVVYVNLDKPLVSQIFINGRIQRIEYEFLPIVCFQCGRYGHVKEGCTQKKTSIEPGKETHKTESLSTKSMVKVDGGSKPSDHYGPWMLVETKSRRKTRDPPQSKNNPKAGIKEGSRFSTLSLRKESFDQNLSNLEKEQDIRRRKGKEIINIVEADMNLKNTNSNYPKNWANSKEHLTKKNSYDVASVSKTGNS